MSDWLIALWVIALVAVTLTLLIWYAHRSGKNEALYEAAKKKAREDKDTIHTVDGMAQAEARKPTSKDAIIARLEKGDA